jgi:16S rRNA (cytosine967-C5)-methyltransferase
VLGTLRWQIRLDFELHALIARPGARLEPEVAIALRLGAFQILRMERIPARAAIDESVELAKRAGHRFASRMVNAVLRRLASAPRRDFPEDSAEQIALACAHPAWMVERWAEVDGLATARAICCSGQMQPAPTVRLVTPEAEEELAQAGIVLQPAYLVTAARRIAGTGGAAATFSDERVRMQDEGSQLIAELAAHAARASVGSPSEKRASILDACAAPGGKTLILAERQPQARVLACESNRKRFDALCLRLAPYADRIECRLVDATEPIGDGTFDLVLVDAPCSGTGTLGRNPEIRHRLKLADLPRQAQRQKAILQSALSAVRPGGRVVYSTCSLEPEENQQVIEAILTTVPHIRLVPLDASIRELLSERILTPGGADALLESMKPRESGTPMGFLRLLPGKFETDGFFIAMLERVE